jgi:hypothetical protein
MTTENNEVQTAQNLTYKDLVVGRTYRAKAESWDIGKSSQKGTIEVLVRMLVLIQPPRTTADGKTVPEIWVRAPKRLYFSENAYARSMESLIIMGFEGTKLSDLADGGGNLDANEVEVLISLKPAYDGDGDKSKARDPEPEIAFINRVGGGGATTTPLDADELAIADRKFTEMLELAKKTNFGRASRGSAGTPKPSANGTKPTKADKPTPATDDEIPF